MRDQTICDAQGLLKLIVDARNEKLLGMHIVYEQASKLVYIGQLVMNLNRHGARFDQQGPQLALDCTHQLEQRKAS